MLQRRNVFHSSFTALSVPPAFGLDSSPGGDAAEHTALPSLLSRILYSPLSSPPARCCINLSAVSFSSVPVLKMATASQLREPYATQDASIKRRPSSEILSTLSWELFLKSLTDLTKCLGGTCD